MPKKTNLSGSKPETVPETIIDVRSGMDVGSLKQAVTEHLFYQQGRNIANTSLNDLYMAVSYTVRDRLKQREHRTMNAVFDSKDVRLVSYLSAEFLLGPQLGVNLIALNIFDEMKQAVEELGFNFDEIIAQEEEPGLGNGGLGRLAACYIDSMAHCKYRLLAMEYGMSLASSIRRSVMAGRWK